MFWFSVFYRLGDDLLHCILKTVVRESCLLITKCQTVARDDFQKLLSTVPVRKSPQENKIQQGHIFCLFLYEWKGNSKAFLETMKMPFLLRHGHPCPQLLLQRAPLENLVWILKAPSSRHFWKSFYVAYDFVFFPSWTGGLTLFALPHGSSEPPPQ